MLSIVEKAVAAVAAAGSSIATTVGRPYTYPLHIRYYSRSSFIDVFAQNHFNSSA